MSAPGTTRRKSPGRRPGARLGRHPGKRPGKRPGKQRNRAFWFWTFVGPFVAGLALFTYVPLAWSVYLSLFDAHNTVSPTDFVGLGNYTAMLGDPAFRSSLVTFAVFTAFIVPATYALSLGLALAVNRLRFAQAFFRSVFFLPAACSYVVAAMVWKLSVFNGVRFGLANTVLGWFGAEPVAWLASTDPPWYWLVIVTVRLWLQAGFYMVLFLAGLQRVPVRLYEAAALDGARPGWQTFRHITFPALRATSVAVVLLLVVGAFQAFDEFYNLLSDSRGYPPYARPPLVYLYYTALGQGQDLGLGSAGAVILALIIAVVTVVQARVSGLGRKEE
ncbi:carbohydrate ABC transporter permease [Streptomyces albireticuli]|uniref:Sugar ABC transporter permease n=1 Tax=Streptomyces albireticuli TaxID=1940 RepID=A0A2A2DGW1_9ACTN|nr:sugar ABC transporter permease [Streptomyces albireticuli]MCD9141855.1 sugar ABC transporter permease [Streptomyces albireticuli]MCD9163201.1 sugar ABC transporter permease [Streptomyces albireticuli]MCD9190028.1 sugar ABC transporter permease [Streptomyces albireticuli]PAU50639.1 sugar ABC transporter permease [Streptomyces albireticuli]